MPPSAVVDASVLVSAFLFRESIPGRVVRLAAEGGFAMHLSPVLVEEMRRSLLNPRLRTAYGHDEAAVHTWCDDLARIGTVFTAPCPILARPAATRMMITSSPLPLSSSPATRTCWLSADFRLSGLYRARLPESHGS